MPRTADGKLTPPTVERFAKLAAVDWRRKYDGQARRYVTVDMLDALLVREVLYLSRAWHDKDVEGKSGIDSQDLDAIYLAAKKLLRLED